MATSVAAHEVDQFVRISQEKYRDSPLGTGRGPSRFSPRERERRPVFRVLYLARDTATALYETVIRDRFALMAQRVLAPGDYSGRVAFNISTKATQTVSLIDLTGGRDAMHGVPTDVNGAQNQTDGQHFGEFVHANMPAVDGALYRSRFTARDCIAVFDRAIGRLQVYRLVRGRSRPCGQCARGLERDDGGDRSRRSARPLRVFPPGLDHTDILRHALRRALGHRNAKSRCRLDEFRCRHA